jgi:hypothetical protein
LDGKTVEWMEQVTDQDYLSGTQEWSERDERHRR